MKVLFFNTLSAVLGGAERMLMDTSVELLSRGHQVSIVIAYDDRRSKHPEFWPSRINRYYVPELIAPLTDQYSYGRYRRTAAYRDTMRYLRDIIDIEAPDIIHIHNFPSVEPLRELRVPIPIIRTIHSYDNLCENRLKVLPDRSICPHPSGEACRRHCGFEKSFRAMRVRAENRFMRKKFARLLAVSAYVKQVLLENGFAEEQVQVLPNFTRLRPKQLDVGEENTVLHVGRLTPEKGLLELVRSVALTETRPKVLAAGRDGALGRNSYLDQVLGEAQSLGVGVEIEDWTAGDNLRRAYARAKVVAFSSVWPDPFGLVGIEAMMMGKPVVASDSGGVRDWLLHGETGFLVPRLDVARFASRLDQLISNDVLRRAMGSRAQQHAKDHFSPDAHMTRLLDLYQEVSHESSIDRPGRCAEVRDAQCGSGVLI